MRECRLLQEVAGSASHFLTHPAELLLLALDAALMLEHIVHVHLLVVAVSVNVFLLALFNGPVLDFLVFAGA